MRLNASAKQRRFYDKDSIKEEGSPEIVAELLGIQTRRYGNRISILCPCHDDRHYGSCFLTKDGFHCYACHANGTVFDMVMKTMNMGFSDACQYLGDMLGLEPISNDGQPKPLPKKILSDEILVVLGLAPSSEGGIYCGTEIISEMDKIDDYKGRKIEWEPFDCKSVQEYASNCWAAGYNIVMECVDRNPLQTLLNEDEAAYRNLIYRKAVESKERYERFSQMALQPESFYNDIEDISQLQLALECADVAKIVGLPNFIKFMQDKQRLCENLMIEYGETSKNDNEKKEKRKNIFGKIREKGAF